MAHKHFRKCRRGRRRRFQGRGFGIAAARAGLPILKRLAVPLLKKAILPGLASAGAEVGFRKLFGQGRRYKKKS